MKRCVLVVEFGNNAYNNKLIEHLKPRYHVERYDLFANKRITTHDYNKIDYLILGGAKNTIGIKKLLKLPKQAVFNPLYEAFDIIKKMRSKPILGTGYGCLVLGLYYRCTVEALSHPNDNTKQHLIVDHRYKINRLQTNGSINMYVTFNNKNRLLTADDSEVDLIAFSAENKFDPCGFRFSTNHYGFLFRLIDTRYGKNILNNFLIHHS